MTALHWLRAIVRAARLAACHGGARRRRWRLNV